MYEENKTTDGPTAPPQSLMEAQAIHSLVTRLEEKLRPVLRPSIAAKESTIQQQVKSELMQELGYVQSRLDELLERLHI